MDIVCRLGNIRPDAVVLVATVKALKHHAGDPDGGLDAIETGAANMLRHIGIVREFGINPVVAVNRFPDDTDESVELVKKLALEGGAYGCEVNDGFSHGRRRRRGTGRDRDGRGRREDRLSTSSTRSTPRSRTRSTRSQNGSMGPTGSSFSRPHVQRSRSSTSSATTACRSAWRRPTCRCPTTRSSRTRRSVSRSASATSAPTRAPGGSWRSAATCRPCPATARRPAAMNVDIDERGETVGLF